VQQRAPGPVDRAWQLAYRAAYAALRLWWRLAHPVTHGALVALWHHGEVLLVRNAYRRGLSLPGGFVKADEDPAAAAARELREELGIIVAASDLRPAWHGRRLIDHRTDDARILEAVLTQRPLARPDNREVVWVGWFTPENALATELSLHVRDYLAGRTADGQASQR